MHLLAGRFVSWGVVIGVFERGIKDLSNGSNVTSKLANVLSVFTSIVYVGKRIWLSAFKRKKRKLTWLNSNVAKQTRSLEDPLADRPLGQKYSPLALSTNQCFFQARFPSALRYNGPSTSGTAAPPPTTPAPTPKNSSSNAARASSSIVSSFWDDELPNRWRSGRLNRPYFSSLFTKWSVFGESRAHIIRFSTRPSWSS